MPKIDAPTSPRPATNTRLLGLRQPGRPALAMFRMPLPMYRRGWGRLLGRTFLVLTHAGRRSGALYDTAAMVLADDPRTGEVVICSAWGADADWVRNIRVRPAVRVRVGSADFAPGQRFLSDDQAMTVVHEFRNRHPWRLRFLAYVLGWGDVRDDTHLRALVSARPFVAFRPVEVS